MSRPLRRRTGARGSAIVEVLVIVAVVLGLGLLAMMTLAEATNEQANKSAECIVSMACSDGDATGDSQGKLSDLGAPETPPSPDEAAARSWYESLRDGMRVKMGANFWGARLEATVDPNHPLSASGWDLAWKRVKDVPLVAFSLPGGFAKAELTADFGVTTDGRTQGTLTARVKAGIAEGGVKFQSTETGGATLKPYGQVKRDMSLWDTKVFGFGVDLGLDYKGPSLLPSPAPPPP